MPGRRSGGRASRFRASWILSDGKILLQLANELANALSGADRGRERTIELAVKKELPVLGIEAHDIGRQHVDGEIRRELRNVFAVTLRRAVPAIACHEAGTRASRLTATSLDRHCKARILHWRRHRRRARAPERNPTRSLGRTWSSPVMTPCVCQRNRNAPESSRCGKLPRTSSSRSLRSLRTRRSLRNRGRSLGSLYNRGRNLGSRRMRGQIARRVSACRRFPCRRRRTSPG